MPDISNLKIGTNSYSIKDPTARTTASNADVKSDQAIQDSAEAQQTATNAQQTATNAQTSANNANTKIDNSKITSNYTESTETLEILLDIGTI